MFLSCDCSLSYRGTADLRIFKKRSMTSAVLTSSSRLRQQIARCEGLTAQLQQAQIKKPSSTEALLLISAGRRCASETASLIALVEGSDDNTNEASRGTPFHLRLELRNSKTALLQSLSAAATGMLQEEKGRNPSAALLKRLSRKDACPRNANESDLPDSSGAKGRTPSDREELEVLLRTRHLIAVENMKLDQVMSCVGEGSHALQQLNKKLETVDETLSVTHAIVASMIRVKTLDDVIVRASWVLFVCVVLFVWTQRLFSFVSLSFF